MEQVSTKADIWALGCVLAAMLTGGLLWPADIQPMEIMMVVAVNRSSPEVPESTPAPLAALISRCFSTAQIDRPTAEQLVSLLLQVATDLDGPSVDGLVVNKLEKLNEKLEHIHEDLEETKQDVKETKQDVKDIGKDVKEIKDDVKFLKRATKVSGHAAKLQSLSALITVLTRRSIFERSSQAAGHGFSLQVLCDRVQQLTVQSDTHGEIMLELPPKELALLPPPPSVGEAAEARAEWRRQWDAEAGAAGGRLDHDRVGGLLTRLDRCGGGAFDPTEVDQARAAHGAADIDFETFVSWLQAAAPHDDQVSAVCIESAGGAAAAEELFSSTEALLFEPPAASPAATPPSSPRGPLLELLPHGTRFAEPMPLSFDLPAAAVYASPDDEPAPEQVPAGDALFDAPEDAEVLLVLRRQAPGGPWGLLSEDGESVGVSEDTGKVVVNVKSFSWYSSHFVKASTVAGVIRRCLEKQPDSELEKVAVQLLDATAGAESPLPDFLAALGGGSLKARLAVWLVAKLWETVRAIVVERTPPRQALPEVQPPFLRMDAAAPHAPKTFAVAATGVEIDAKTNRPFLLRTYPKPEGGLQGTSSCKIWEAGRATGAAPTYFDHMEIGDQPLIDGGVTANNPVQLAIEEAGALWPRRPVGCLVSLGCGQMTEQKRSSSKVGRLFFGALGKMSETEEAHEQTQRQHCHRGPGEFEQRAGPPNLC
eukprot:SAG31_NODE_6040_length_2197_cov_1.075786_1_plen_708_part_00